MGWRFLIDEDTDASTANELAGRGHDAVTVTTAIGKGTPDARVARFARETNRMLITTDRDFLDPELSLDLEVLLVSANDADGEEIAKSAAELTRLADEPTDLRRVTWL